MGDVTPVPKRRDKIFSFAPFNLDALLSLATQLRGGMACTTNVSQTPKSGCLNWVIFIAFNDGIEWVFRSPRRSKNVKTESHYKMIISEAYTLNGSHDNDIKVPYILMSKVPGRALFEYDWADAFRVPDFRVQMKFLPMTDRDREKVMGQLGGIMSLLSDIKFDKIGSLFAADDGSGDCSVGECLNPSLIWENRDQLQGIDRGPFNQESQYFSSLISAFVSHAKELPLTPHTFFMPIPNASEYRDFAGYKAAVDRWEDFYVLGEGAEGSKNRLSYCLAGEFLREMIPSLVSDAAHSRGFVPCHPDLHTGNIFVDENFNVTGIIDWGSAYAGPLSELLATPGLSGSTLPPEESLVAAFRAGFSQGGKTIKTIDPELWVKGEMMWRFSRLVRLLASQDYTLFKALFGLVHKDGSDEIPRMFYERSMQGHGRELLAKLQEDAGKEKSVWEKLGEEEGRPKRPTERVAVARKLVLMSEMNRNFVTDKRLWRWLGDALDKTDSK
ncbi:rnase h domain containing protein [Ophiostoma piceae UAMH 11346]|uniref:Rnase h domain containing protein n=1 Tax=Ophiostoma piceae (strain UAMH 11346) TaxID=1262450 RepID=S3D906_OPHP1|nr:rnase h domain containing protein [Ophiostoma piceae UAMH 11346]